MKYSLLLASAMISFSSFASTPMQWRCIAMDSKDRSFFATQATIENSMSAAIAKCKHASNQPNTCKSAQSFCEQRPFNGDRCLVTDDNGHAWDIDGENACKKALQMCNRFIYLEGGAHGQCWIKHGSEDGNLDVD